CARQVFEDVFTATQMVYYPFDVW
nr:immunoglobulin heavy chain junction region [Macaca mulatta]MOV53428.1 immunoglobulin heavy chain junction region [Macaca mulatta]MOV53490.1 immunoglobulin heavy chain junction region [Macaca mulatta]MOV54057.1 immunoglobulin heavy chain junction region [Macaca mulatta]MOV54250.1 immunoglobulin heavy chain junction region [Macaca mulatta]